MIVSMKDLYADAQKNNYLLGAFNIFNYDTLCCVLEAAVEERSPVILQISMGTRRYTSDFRQFVRVVCLIAEETPVPVCVNHDHCPTVDAALQAVDAGVGGVMFDGSGLSFEENEEKTRRVVEYAHAKGIWVEAELGKLPGFEDEIFAGHAEFTHPVAARRFVEETGCDSLAVSVGTAHGGVKAEKELQIDFDVLERIHREIPSVPLVLHGAASLPARLIGEINCWGGQVEAMKNCGENEIRRTAAYGVCKANMDVDNFLAYTGAVRKQLTEHRDKYDPRLYLRMGKQAWKEEVSWKMRGVLRSAGHNWLGGS